MSSLKASAQIISVWSAAGSPGRTTIAAAVAAEKAKTGCRVLVLDADSYAPSIEFQFGIEQAHAGIASIARLAIQGRLTEEQLDNLSVDFQFGKINLKIITGLSMPDRWQEVGFDGMKALIDFAAQYFDCIVIDIASPLDQDLINQHSLVQRNSMTIAALKQSTQVIAICAAEALDVHRFVWEYQLLNELKLDAETHVLINQSTGQHRQVAQTIVRLTGAQPEAYIDFDPSAAARAKQDGVPINLAGRNSSPRTQLAKFVLTKLG